MAVMLTALQNGAPWSARGRAAPRTLVPPPTPTPEIKIPLCLDGIVPVCYGNGMEQRIDINPEVCHGNPVIKGTRVLVSQIVGALAGGDGIEAILEDYPGITKEDVYAALAFAGDLTRFEEAPYDNPTEMPSLPVWAGSSAICPP